MKLAAVHQFCDANEDSLEKSIQMMEDVAGVNLNTVIAYLALGELQLIKLRDEVNQFTDIMIKLGN